MSATQERQVFGSLISPAFSFTHGMCTELHHPFADDVCLALAASHLGQTGIQGKDLVHIGAGFGAELRSALFAGAKSVIGLDQAADQVEFAQSLANVMHDPEYVLKLLKNDRVVPRLYSNPKFLVLENVTTMAAERCRNEFYQLRAHFNVLSAGQCNDLMPLRLCDVLNDDILTALAGNPRDVLIGNIMLHWLVRGGITLKAGLDKLAPAVKEGGAAVFSVPYHFIEQENPQADAVDRVRCVYDTSYYLALRKHLLEKLPDQKFPPSADFRKVESMLIREQEVKEGSIAFEHVMTYRRYFAPLLASMHEVLLGLGLYEAVLRTGKPDTEVVDYVIQAIRSALDEVKGEITRRERPATFVYFFVFRRR